MAYNYNSAPTYPSQISAVNNVYDLNSLGVPYTTVSVNVTDCQSITGFGGNISATGITGNLTTNTANNALTIVQSSPIKFVVGELTRARFGVSFSPGVANTSQAVGLIDQNNGLAFGYQGNTFGILTRSGGTTDVRQISITQAANTAGNVSLQLDGTTFQVPVLAGDSIRTVTRKIAVSKQDTWNTLDAGNVVLVSSWLNGPRTGAFSFAPGSTGVIGNISPVTVGNTGTVAFIPSTSWNIDPINGTQSLPLIDPTKNQVYAISFQNSGFGAATFAIQNPNDARFYPVHRQILNGSNVAPMLNTEALPIRVRAQGNGASVSVTTATMQVDVFNPPPANQVSGVNYVQNLSVSNYTVRVNKLNHMMSLLNNYINPNTGAPNYSTVQLVSIALSFDGTGSMQFSLLKNASLGDPSVYPAVNAQYGTGTSISFTPTSSTSVSSVYRGSCDVTGGTLMSYSGLVKGGNQVQNVQNQSIIMNPGDLMTFAVQGVDAINYVGTDVTISCLFVELT